MFKYCDFGAWSVCSAAFWFLLDSKLFFFCACMSLSCCAFRFVAARPGLFGVSVTPWSSCSFPLPVRFRAVAFSRWTGLGLLSSSRAVLCRGFPKQTKDKQNQDDLTGKFCHVVTCSFLKRYPHCVNVAHTMRRILLSLKEAGFLYWGHIRTFCFWQVKLFFTSTL